MDEDISKLIEHNIPIPKYYREPSKTGKLAMMMKKGDSILLDKSSQVSTMRNALKREGKNCKSMKLSNGKYRLWCL